MFRSSSSDLRHIIKDKRSKKRGRDDDRPDRDHMKSSRVDGHRDDRHDRHKSSRYESRKDDVRSDRYVRHSRHEDREEDERYDRNSRSSSRHERRSHDVLRETKTLEVKDDDVTLVEESKADEIPTTTDEVQEIPEDVQDITDDVPGEVAEDEVQEESAAAEVPDAMDETEPPPATLDDVQDVSNGPFENAEEAIPYFPSFQGCRSVDEFLCMNRIEEGTYGVVFRAKCKITNEVVALKRLKMEKEKEGFPITSLREISTLLKSGHENIVGVKEIVVGNNMDKIYIVMEYVEHDLKSLMESMKKPFLMGEVKTLLRQLLSAIAHLHDNWILHRDLKTSNLLLNHRGILKVGDFGLAREYGSPLKPYTPVVVTLWYRAPELLLGGGDEMMYSTPIDLWSIGCIFGELLIMKPLFPGKSELNQLELIFRDLGTPNDKIWPGYSQLKLVQKIALPQEKYSSIHLRFKSKNLSESGFQLLNKLLAYCPDKRITAAKALEHPFFQETPLPTDPALFPSWPAKSEGGIMVKRVHSPKAPTGGQKAETEAGEKDEVLKGGGFVLRF